MEANISAYPAAFEAAFPVDCNGNMKCSDNVEAWYNSQLDFYHLLFGFKPPSLCLKDPHSDIQLVCAYTYAYCAYRKMCNMQSRTPICGPSLCPPFQ